MNYTIVCPIHCYLHQTECKLEALSNLQTALFRIVCINNLSVVNPRITYENDVALLRLAESLVFNQLVAPLALPQPGQNFTSGELCA